MKQTAVEWLVDILLHKVQLTEIEKMYVEQAKEMEKEQIKNAWYNSLTKGDYNSADEYYNKTFKSEKQSYQDKMRDKITKAKSRLK